MMKSIKRLVVYALRRCRKFLLAVVITTLLAILVNPYSAHSLDLSDLLRIVPSVIQVVEISNISDTDEVKLGSQINRNILSQVRLSRNREANNLVKSIGAELVPQSDRPNIPYTFQVVDDPDINAFATMGGFVYINTGTIAAADNRAQLASVIAHEMGHIAGRHALEQVKQQAITQGIVSIVGADRNQIVNIGTELALRLPNSREAEFDADRRGLQNLNNADYAVQAMPDFMQKLARSSNNAPDFLNTHPAVKDRIVALNQMIRDNSLQGYKGLDNTAYQKRWRSARF
ncbi:Peptidase family M48 [Synechococcus sp. PCC 7502]|uniref:M48 family metallopeptidase n=1 Tax=Synechococcus sp. PCC 7502 TaxID=1173263 RepID=UPI00029FFC8C|nr:M48 family metallopeptidase [Synechococcus sp. PCC 7502]AFY72922.1 Peptidase family M48 [Synechococcus sp. PCC 7502]